MRASKVFLILLVLAFSGCDLGWRTLKSSEYAVKFKVFPTSLGGGVEERVYSPGQLVLVWPWEVLYRFETKIRTLEWGAKGREHEPHREDYVLTRAFDGNEVSLAVKLEYRLSSDHESLKRLIQNVGVSDDAVEHVVVAAARADIRTPMNKLKTSEFFKNEAKYRGEAEIKEVLQKRLGKYGIEVVSVNLKEHRFERVLPDGSVDRSYQEKINEVQKKEQDTKREELRIATITADKQTEYNDVKALFNRQVAEADGYKKQLTFRADAYFETRSNQAKAVMARGKAEAEGLAEQIKALAGPGGEEILKIDIAKELENSGANFITMDSSNNQEINVNRVDSNRLLEQLGIIEALKEKPKTVEAK